MVLALRKCSGVKRVDREGWKRRALIREPESVADHIFAVTLAAMMAGDLLQMDVAKMMRMAILHDVCEALTGDVQPGAIAAAKKEEAERVALAKLLEPLPAALRDSYLTAFDEFNHGSSREATMCRDLDKLEMVVQALDYESSGVEGELLDEFWRTTGERIRSPEGRRMLSSAASLRPRR
jgi:putative hydrolase of HD superfamily